jgi:hypothetical protein
MKQFTIGQFDTNDALLLLFSVSVAGVNGASGDTAGRSHDEILHKGSFFFFFIKVLQIVEHHEFCFFYILLL